MTTTRIKVPLLQTCDEQPHHREYRSLLPRREILELPVPNPEIQRRLARWETRDVLSAMSCPPAAVPFLPRTSPPFLSLCRPGYVPEKRRGNAGRRFRRAAARRRADLSGRDTERL